jgi:hypothetical protein
MLSVGLYAPCEPGPALPAGAVVQYGREMDKVVRLGRDGMGMSLARRSATWAASWSR